MRPAGQVSDEMTVPGYPLLLYVDSDPALRRLADATFRTEYIVEAVASVEETYDGIEPAVAVINLSDEADPQRVWDILTERWPMVPAVVVLTTEAAMEKDREAFWALEPASMVVNPFSPDAMHRGVTVALS
jgi:CheY-like chemotaxis protein